MKRWNGWGDSAIHKSLPVNAAARLVEWIGEATPPTDAPLPDVLATVPATRLPNHPLITTDADIRLRHARGQSFPDWVAARSGRIGHFPDGVAFPQSDDDVAALLTFARQHNVTLIPYGGGTSVVGHINPAGSDKPVLTVSMARLNALRRLDSKSQLATFGAGVSGPVLEAHLRANGFTLGHFPQSFDYSTLGGWIATRSSGQQSAGYGRIDDMFAGGTVLAPAGTLRLPPLPSSSAGPDLRRLILGSEGRLGIVTEATVRVTPLPQKERFHGVFFADFAAGTAAVREILQGGIPISMARLSNPVETETLLQMAGHERVIAALERLVALRGVAGEKALLLLGFTGRTSIVNAARRDALSITRAHGGVHVGSQFGSEFMKTRFTTPYLRNTLWDVGYGVDTMETATSWDCVETMMTAMESAARDASAAFGEKIHAYTHLSHVYPTGCSVYMTCAFRLCADPDEQLERWRALKRAVSTAIVSLGGTISHQHGVGRDHRPYLSAEIGATFGTATLLHTIDHFDPDGILNSGNLVGGHDVAST